MTMLNTLMILAAAAGGLAIGGAVCLDAARPFIRIALVFAGVADFIAAYALTL